MFESLAFESFSVRKLFRSKVFPFESYSVRKVFGLYSTFPGSKVIPFDSLAFESLAFEGFPVRRFSVRKFGVRRFSVRKFSVRKFGVRKLFRSKVWRSEIITFRVFRIIFYFKITYLRNAAPSDPRRRPLAATYLALIM